MSYGAWVFSWASGGLLVLLGFVFFTEPPSHPHTYTVTIDGCEYVGWSNGTVLTHKANCSNPQHQIK